ncbi:MAG: sigma-70 family RNA polymerase sigma factor [Verrucomicrobia bacterium]|nr:sigma-70 family RNA polymerase sigma factor [Verrucomicrobiota bacterium]MCF7707747.1 sigma-70 family RNA polymerase sigma factor [Verrucomicrobiota bacterium]
MPIKNNNNEIGDSELVDSARHGDTVAFGELIGRHSDKIYNRAFSIMRNREDALDISQEAWIKAWQRLSQFNGRSSFLTWINRITINLCLDCLRRNKRFNAESMDQIDEESGGVERQLPIETPNPTRRLERHELRERIDEALQQISHEHRTVLILHEFEGLEYKEIAEAMECSIGTVMSRLFYARRKMAVLLSGLRQEGY